MEGKKLLHSISLTNLLSYGSEGVMIELEPLNVLIGPNASGKSNLIEAISLLAAAPRDLQKPIREGGGIEDWLWKGGESIPIAVLKTLVDFEDKDFLLSHELAFSAIGPRFKLVDESIELEPRKGGRRPPVKDRLIYHYHDGKPVIRTRTGAASGEAKLRKIDPRGTAPDQSILSQERGSAYPELTSLSSILGNIVFFRDWNLGRLAALRRPQRTDLPEDFLLENASNLGLVLNHLQHRPATWRVLLDSMRTFHEDLEDVTTKVQGGTVQVFFHLRGLDSPIPAYRLSDGTLRYLSLLTILCHPDPPPLICIEEPELGLHPDMMRTVASLLVEASKRSQLIVTTHSEMLISGLSEVPESVVVCERYPDGTRLSRLDPGKLEWHLERHRLGDIWAMGEIGGNRW
jgi:predicted ATPase